MARFNFLEYRFQQLSSNVRSYLKDMYKKADEVFNSASPYGQILEVVEMIFQSSVLSLKNIVNQYDLSDPDNLNERTIRSIARIAGHDPARGNSARGTLKLQIRPEVDIQNEIGGNRITIANHTRLRNTENNLNYFVELGQPSITVQVENNTEIFLPIVQGSYDSQIFTGDGTINQSFSVNVPNTEFIAQSGISVSVNGEIWAQHSHLWDMVPDEKAYFVRTGFTGGIEIWFGNANFGKIPEIGDRIVVNYILTSGANGNILNKTPNMWSVLDEVFDYHNEIVDLEALFFFFVEEEINFGSDNESVEYTKAIMPFVSRNFVLARPEQYVYQLRRLGMFSQINAYTTEKGSIYDDENPEDDSTVYLFLVPNFRNYLDPDNTMQNYFTLPEDAFTLDEIEKNKIYQYLTTQGIMTLGTNLQIVQPQISRYVLNVRIRMYEKFLFKNVRLEILDALSNYFIEIQRRDRIPRSDLIRVVEEVAGVDSVDVQIVSQRNEEYHSNFETYKKSIMLANPAQNPDLITLEGYDPNLVIGLDPELGDILLNNDELVLIRGGWPDRYGVVYEQIPTGQGLGSVNISVIGNVRKSLNI